MKVHAYLGLTLGVVWMLLHGLAILHIPFPLSVRIPSLFLGPFALITNMQLYYSSGTLRYSRLSYGIWACCALLIAAVLFKLMHWPYANEMLIVAPCILVVIYVVHFVQKPDKRLGDILRLLVVIITGNFFVMLILRWVAPEQYAFAVMGICLITTLEYLLSSYNAPPPITKWDDDESKDNLTEDHPELFE